MEKRRYFATEASGDFNINLYKPKGRLRPRESNQLPISIRKDVKVGIQDKLS